MKESSQYPCTFALLALVSSLALAYDPSRLQDFCVALDDIKNGVRIDFAPYGGMNPPHTHPRSTKVLVVPEGALLNPGVLTIVNAVFGSDPPINPNVLTKAFMLDKNVVQYLQSKF
ncbi:hypothetical protein SLE2022_054290 [Rubroshorea leprosula]